MSAPSLSSETVHASCVAIDGRAVLIGGRSGTGKSDLALRLIDRGAALVSDDYTFVRRVERPGARQRAGDHRRQDRDARRRHRRARDGAGRAGRPVRRPRPRRPSACPSGEDADAVAGVAIPTIALDGHRGLGAAQGGGGAAACSGCRPDERPWSTSFPSLIRAASRPTPNLVLDMRFLQEPALAGGPARPRRPRPGRSAPISPATRPMPRRWPRIEAALLTLLPLYRPTANPCLGRVRLYRRAPSLGPCRRASRGTVARGGIFAHVSPIATSPRRRATVSSDPQGAGTGRRLSR